MQSPVLGPLEGPADCKNLSIPSAYCEFAIAMLNNQRQMYTIAEACFFPV